METYLLVMMGFSAVFAWLVARRSKSAVGLRTMLGITVGGVFGSLLLGSAVLLLQTILTLILLVLVATFHVRPRHAVAAIVAAAPLAFAAMAAVTVWERFELLRDFPVVSIADRLEYETRKNNPTAEPQSPAEAAVTPFLLPPSAEQRLAMVEKQRGFDWRRELLRRLHDSKFAAFVAAEGFGPERMEHVRRSRLEPPEIKPVSPPPRPAQNAQRRCRP